MVVREESHPSGTHCMSEKTKHRVWSSFPVLLGCEFDQALSSSVHLAVSDPAIGYRYLYAIGMFGYLYIIIYIYIYIFCGYL